LYSGRTRRVCAILTSKCSFWIWSRSKLAMSSTGTPNVRDANTASCAADMRLPDRTCSTNVMPACCAWLCSVSASYSVITPCCAMARARPLMFRVVAAWVAMGGTSYRDPLGKEKDNPLATSNLRASMPLPRLGGAGIPTA
jgi:hypothetical protein